MTLGMPSVIDLYESLADKLAPVIGAIKPEKLGNQTPCSEWNAQGLMIHLIKGNHFAHSMLTGSGEMDVMGPRDVSGPLPSEGAEKAFRTGVAKVLEASRASAPDKMVDFGMGPMPVDHFLMLFIGDFLIHKWDLAKGTDQDTSLDSSMAEVVYGALSQGIDGARKAGFFGPEVPVSSASNIQDRLLGLSGRQP